MEVRPQAATHPPDAAGPSGTQRPPAAAAAATGAKMTKANKEAALRKLVADGWLKHSARGGHYSLGVRTFLELGLQLLDLPDLPEETKAVWQDLM
jgi:DNA-binding IclR family transcriptional regulator